MGQQISSAVGPGAATWEIIGLGDGKLRWRGLVSRQEIDCDRFCYVVTEATGIPWPPRPD